MSALASPSDSISFAPTVPLRAFRADSVGVHAIGIAALAVAAIVAPAWLLVLMPIALGVPHVVNDVRYLVLPLPRRQIVIAAVASAALIGCRALMVAGLPAQPLYTAEAILVAAWLLAAVGSAGGLRAAGIAALGAALIVGAPFAFIVAAGFAHNVIALVAWVVVARPRARSAALVIGGALAATLAVALVAPTFAAAAGTDRFAGLTLASAAKVLLPGTGGAAVPLLVAFVFLQAVHYLVWLHWVPRAEGTRTIHPGILVFALVAFAAVLLAAVVDVKWARATYLGLATFHIYLELVILAVRFTTRRR
jgi:hypothetical protein